MLLSLHIENIAIIKRLDIDFSKGLNVLTGETGAGKSVLIDSISFLLGGRVTRDILARGADRGMVSGLFGQLTCSERNALGALGLLPDEDGTFLFERTLGADGRSQSRINGRMVNLSLLRQAASFLIQIHGQADTAMLSEPAYAITTLDLYADAAEELSAYQQAYHRLVQAKRTLNEHLKQEGERIRLVETLQAQIAEIEKVSPRVGEEDQLYERKNVLKNAERITKHSSFSYRALKGSERGSVIYILEHVRQSLLQLAPLIPAVSDHVDTLDRILDSLDGMAEEIRAYADYGDDDPEAALNELETRLDELYKLSRKYGGDLASCLTFLSQSKEKLAALENYEDTEAALTYECRQAEQITAQAANKLHGKREASAVKLADALTSTLKMLDLPRIRMEVSVHLRYQPSGDLQFDEHGADEVKFLFSANVGEEPGDLSRVASGGEVARVMLALRDALAEKMGVSTAIYDEIDTGVSGKTARKIGVKMLDTATRGQVLCVTHSAQIASLADCHFLISKNEKEGHTEVCVQRLEDDVRVEEIARILGGIRVTDVQRSAAREMLGRHDVT